MRESDPYPLQNIVLLGDHEKAQPRARLLYALYHAGVLLAPGRCPVDGNDAVAGAQSCLSRRRICSHLLHENRVHGLVDFGPLVSRQHLQQRAADPLSFSPLRTRFRTSTRLDTHATGLGRIDDKVS